MEVKYTEKQIDDLLEDYYIPCDDGDYHPTEHEKFVVKNFLMGLSDMLTDLLGSQP